VTFDCGMFVFDLCILFVLLVWYIYCCDFSIVVQCDLMDAITYVYI